MEVLEIKAHIEFGGNHTLSCLGHCDIPEPWPPCRTGVLGRHLQSESVWPWFLGDVEWFVLLSQLGPTDQPAGGS